MTSTAATRPPGGLRGRLDRILHWDLAVRDLAGSVAFYEALTPFRSSAVVETVEPAGRLRSALLSNSAWSGATPGLRLAEWLEPRSSTPPEADEASVGFFRIVFHVVDSAAVRATAAALGAPPFAPTTGDDFRFEIGSRGSVPFAVWACHDPDGVVVEFIEHPHPKLSTVAQGTADLATAVRFAAGTLGFDHWDTVRTPGPVPNVYRPGGAPVEFVGEFLRARGDERGYLDILQHRRTPAGARASDDPTRLGLTGVTIQVDDVDAAHATLRDDPLATIPGPPFRAELGEPLGTRRALDVLDPEGVRYRLVERERRAVALPTSVPGSTLGA